MTLKNQIIILIVCTAGGVAVGRFTIPVKVVTQVKTVEVEKKSEKTDTKENKKQKKETTIVQVKKPDGTVETTTKITVDTGVDKDTSTTQHQVADTSTDTKKEVVKDSGHLNISALAGFNPFTPTTGVVYGAHVTRDILGPINIGLFGLSNGMLGCSVGLTF